MCSLNGYKPMADKTLEEYYNGRRHKLYQTIQEEQGVVDCYV